MKKYLVLLAILFVSHVQAVTLVWDPRPAEEQVLEYNIYKVKGNNTTMIATVEAPVTSLNVDSFLTGRTEFFVTAVNSAGEGAESAHITIHK